MPMLDMVSSLIMIAAVAIATFATRAASFVVFPKGKEVPPTVKYIGMVLPPAVIGMLVVYCLRSTQLFAYPYGIPELIACLAVIGLHAWKRNVLLSVGAGTVLYMALVQMVFV
ncbi:MAG TPA: branched-chain amino acid transporter permease [Euryarchaeota archaeon]|nr:branched-chain amino acid transporter permease [Euryarchaeota archaeon]